MDAPIYVVVASNDRGPYAQHHKDEPPNPIVFETNVNGATLDDARARAAQGERQGYGACRVARLVFEGQPGFAEPQSGQKRTSRCPHGVSELNHCTRCD